MLRDEFPLPPEAQGFPIKARKLERGNGSNQERPTAVTLARASDLEVSPIRWIWPGWLARGKLHVLAGQPGTGKTTLAMRMAATVSTGARWPDGKVATLGNVIIWSGEDDPSDTLIPRLAVSGADLDRIYFVSDVVDEKGKRPFDPARDIEPLQRAIEAAGGAALIIVDPIVSAVGADSHKNAETRRSLQPLADLAASVDAALLGIAHFSKGTIGRDPTERINGSVAFGAMARVVMVAAKESDSEDGTAGRRILARAKSNIGPDEGGFAYSLEMRPMPGHPEIEASSVAWGDRIDGSARDMLAAAEATDDPADDQHECNRRGEARDFLLDLLMDGPRQVKEIKAEVSGAGLSWRTIERAKAELGVSSGRDGRAGIWVWALPQDRQPGDQDRQNSNRGGLAKTQENQSVNDQDRQDRQDRQSCGEKEAGRPGIIPNSGMSGVTSQTGGGLGGLGGLAPNPLKDEGFQDRHQDRQGGRVGGLDDVPAPFHDAWARFRAQCQPGIDEARWRQAVADAERFLERHGTLAAEYGWTPGDLFDVPSGGSQGGLAWFLRGEAMRSLGPEHAILESGHVFDRKEGQR